MMEHGNRDRAREGRAVAKQPRKTIPPNHPAEPMYCFMFHFDRIVPDLTDRKAPEISRFTLNEIRRVPAGGRVVAGSNPVSPIVTRVCVHRRLTMRCGAMGELGESFRPLSRAG